MAVHRRSRPLLLLLCAVSAVLGQTVTVESNGLNFLGVQDKSSGINNFLGIRYAEPPVGNLRWRPPVPIRYEADSDAAVHINATTYGPNCVSGRVPWSPFWELANSKKKSHRRKDSHEENFEDEDCLVLNVQTPMKPKSKRLPVLVYIHGGGYVSGSAYPVNGNSLVAQSDGSIIHVQLQYRLGALGFLSGDEVKDDGTANAGLLDQRMALRWVRDNIHVFGGDPTRITISGSSAGGGSVAMQMVMFGGSQEAPFQAAILDFPWWSPMYDRDWQQNQYRNLLRAARCSSLTCLRKASLTRIISATEEASQRAYNKKQFAHGTFYWGPVVDGHVIARHPIREFRDGRFTRIPVLTTRSYDEGFVFTNVSVESEADAVADLSTLWREDDGFFAKTLMMLYPSTVYNRSHLDTFNRRGGAQFLKLIDHPLSDAFVRLSTIFGDAFINCPTSHAARHVVKYGRKAWKLVFKAGYECHGSPLSFLYSENENADGQQDVGDLTFPGNPTLADRLRSYWISFAIHHDPNKGRYSRLPAPSWPEYDPEDPRVLWVEQTSMRTRPDPDNSANCQFFHDCRGNKCGLVEEW